VAVRPGDETGETGDPRAERDQLLEALKAAFVEGRLGKDELVHRVGQALAAYDELDGLAADLPARRAAARPAGPAPASSVVESPEVTREAYNRGLVARCTFGGAGAVMVAVFIVVTAVSGNPFVGFIAGGALGAVVLVFIGAISTLLLWALESSGGGSSRRKRPPRARSAQRMAAAEQPGQPRRDPRHTTEATRDRHLTRDGLHAWA
jgi:hypothetical protein